MLAVSLKWRLGVVRRRPKGTEQTLLWGAGGATGEAPWCPYLPTCFCLGARGVSVTSLLGPRIWVSSLGTCQLLISLNASLGLHLSSSLSTPSLFVWSLRGLSLFLVLLPALMAVLVSLPSSLPYLLTFPLFHPHCLCPRVPFSVFRCLHFSELFIPTPHGTRP